MPLSIESIHAHGVHNWPLGEVKRIVGLSCSKKHFLNAKRYIVRRYIFGMLDDAIIHDVQKSDPYSIATSNRKDVSERLITLILPSHPTLAAAG